MLIISNRPRASRSTDFKITRPITPWIVLYSVQLLLLIVRISDIVIYGQQTYTLNESHGNSLIHKVSL